MHKRVGLSLGRKAKGNTCRGSGFKFLRSDAYMEVSRNPQVCCYLLTVNQICARLCVDVGTDDEQCVHDTVVLHALLAGWYGRSGAGAEYAECAARPAAIL